MLQAAVNQHDKKEAAAQRNPAKMFLSSSPPNTSQHRSYASQKVLQPTPATQLNRQTPHTPRLHGQGVKRMSDGLVKACSNSFEDGDAGKTTAALGLTQENKPIEVIELNEDDFESDVDLDVEEPRQVATIPPESIHYGLPKPIVYPTLPRQQQMHSTYQDPSELVMPSSMPFDWSSSPPQHKLPSYEHSVNVKTHVSSEVVSKDNTSHTGVQRKPSGNPEPHVGFRKASTVQPSAPNPPRRRLPWATDAPIKAEFPSNGMQTPVQTEKKQKATDLWNGSASAIKEQQKKHREEARPVAKKVANPVVAGRGSITTTRQKKLPKVFLSQEQEHVLNLVVNQKASTFFTGSAGTGKSVLLREIIAAFRRNFMREPDRVAVTASTGLAACNIGGVTLHSFAGIGLGKEEVPELVKKIKRNQKAKQRWLRTKVLIIDEVSMVDADLFDKLENVARLVRNNGRAFGGIQLVITGDFFQLPPVPDSGRVAKFCFDANQWNTTIGHTIGLHHVFRQKDPDFAGMLNEMREGRLSPASITKFKQLAKTEFEEADVEATELFPTRREVEMANTARMGRLQGEVFTFEAKDGGTIQDKVQRDKLLSNCMAAERLTLKKGAQVMLIKNIDDDLVNGSIGRVLAFMEDGEFEKYRLDDELAARLSDEANTHDLQESALSREEKARKHLQDNTTAFRKWPMVRFNVHDGTHRDMLCQPESWKIELPNGEVQASRLQVPLILAWALSIHKAQGQTLERVKVNLAKVFEKGQAYVALSRATSKAGLQVLNFDASKVLTHDRVRTFYSNLAKVELQGDSKVSVKA